LIVAIAHTDIMTGVLSCYFFNIGKISVSSEIVVGISKAYAKLIPVTNCQVF